MDLDGGGIRLSPQTGSLLNDSVDRSKDILGDDPTGVYLHGSAVMGRFNPKGIIPHGLDASKTGVFGSRSGSLIDG